MIVSASFSVILLTLKVATETCVNMLTRMNWNAKC